MKLSLCILTRDSAGYVEELLRVGRELADELVVAVDAASSDETEEICGRYADRLFRVETPGHIGPVLAWLNEQCSGDWILRLDDDELPSRELAEAIPDLLEDRGITHCWLRRRWMAADGTRWMEDHPWWPDWQLRLFRNLPSIINVPGKAHTSYNVQGGARYLYEGAIYHNDFVHNDRSERARKVRRRESIEIGKGFDRYYLPDESVILSDPPGHDAPLEPTNEPSTKPNSRARYVGAEEVRRASLQADALDPNIFRAGLRCEVHPGVMRAGEWYPVDVELENTSPVGWPLPGVGVPNVRVGYHWVRQNGRMYEYEGHRTTPPVTLSPGESVSFPASVHAPKKRGNYLLRWDPLIEGVSWFSSHGWRGPELEIRVEA